MALPQSPPYEELTTAETLADPAPPEVARHSTPLGPRPPTRADHWLAKGLGVFSVGLGLAELVAPGHMARLMGIEGRPWLLRACGLREVLSGAAILASRKPATALWSRVAGDVVDLGVLGGHMLAPSTRKARAGLFTAAIAGVTALDVFAAVRLSRAEPGLRTIRFVKTISINRSPSECYALWRDFQGLSRWMRHVESVEPMPDGTTRWTVRGPAGQPVSWDAELVRDEPDCFIAWHSVEGAAVATAGSVAFAERSGAQGTVVRVNFVYAPPAGVAGAFAARLLGACPMSAIAEDLRRFKGLLETGEIAETTGQSHGPRDLVHRSLARLYAGGHA